MRSPVTFLALGIVVLLFLSVSVGSAPLVSAYTFHDPISITSNAMFDEAHGVTNGTGTDVDPYIIEGWEITAASGINAINIQNTTAFFTIKDCSITTVTAWTGIYLLDVTNGNIESNYCYAETFGHGYGILVVESAHITVSYNTVEDTLHGIYISSSNYCTLDTNDTSNVKSYGIFLWRSDNDNVVNNTSNHNKWGILLYEDCENTLIDNNICEYNEAYGIGLFDNCDYNVITNNYCSTDDLFYDTTCIGNEFSGNTGDVISYETETLPQPFPGPTDPDDTPDIPEADPAAFLPLMMSLGIIIGMGLIGLNLSRSSHDPMPGLFMVFTGIMLAWAMGWLDTWIFVTAITFVAILSAILWGKIFSRG